MKRKAYFNISNWLIIIVSLLLFIGTLMVFSSSIIMAEDRFHKPFLFVQKHLLWVFIGIIFLFLFSNIDYKYLQKYSKYISLITIVLLILVFFIGTSRGGARRWLNLGFFNFQPSELAKITFVICLADYLDRKKSKIYKFKGLLPAILIFIIFSFPIILEPDLGTPIIMFFVGLILLYISGARFKYIFIILISIIPFIILEILRKPYRINRIKLFFESFGNLHSSSYQVDKSLLALGSGGIWGKGLGNSQMKLFYLPEPHTDFIFPIIGEEIGFIGTTSVLILFALFVWIGFLISNNCSDLFGNLLAKGITLLIALQALFNIGVACGVLPAKGLPLPFVSFGGSAMIINLIEIGILLNILKQNKKI